MEYEGKVFMAVQLKCSFLPGFLSYPAATAANVGLPFLPGKEAALVSLCLMTEEAFLKSLKRKILCYCWQTMQCSTCVLTRYRIIFYRILNPSPLYKN